MPKSLPNVANREVVPRRRDLSWQRLDRRLDDGIPFVWHHHPEMELTLTMNCRGQRFVGDNVAPFEEGDLALIGPNLPHTWASAKRVDDRLPFAAKVIWFDKDWLAQMGRSAIELEPLASLCDRAGRGLCFGQDTAQRAQPLISRLFDMPAEDGLTTLIDILRLLADDPGAEILASQAVRDDQSAGYERVDRVLNHLHLHYDRPIRLEELAKVAALSPSGLHRMFKRHLQTTLSAYLITLRIGKACARLAATDVPIGIIAQDVGYESQANFNRHFQRQHGMTPRAYRQLHRARW